MRVKRRKALKSDQLLRYLALEKEGVEYEIKKIQASYYVARDIPEAEYTFQFTNLAERLAEIEGERTAIDLLKGKGIIARGKKRLASRGNTPRSDSLKKELSPSAPAQPKEAVLYRAVEIKTKKNRFMESMRRFSYRVKNKFRSSPL